MACACQPHDPHPFAAAQHKLRVVFAVQAHIVNLMQGRVNTTEKVHARFHNDTLWFSALNVLSQQRHRWTYRSET